MHIVIYFIQRDPDGPVTIYRGENVFRKVKNIRRAEGGDRGYLILLGATPGDEAEKTAIVRSLKPCRTRYGLEGEWFKPTSEVLDLIESIPDAAIPELRQAGGRLRPVLRQRASGETTPCPFCGEPHIHGEGSNGHKVTHCGPANLDELRGGGFVLKQSWGYIVVPADASTDPRASR